MRVVSVDGGVGESIAVGHVAEESVEGEFDGYEDEVVQWRVEEFLVVFEGYAGFFEAEAPGEDGVGMLGDGDGGGKRDWVEWVEVTVEGRPVAHV